jgi:predicted RNA methylase
MSLDEQLGAVDPQSVLTNLIGSEQPSYAPNPSPQNYLADSAAIDPRAVLNRLIRKGLADREQRRQQPQPPQPRPQAPAEPVDYAAFAKPDTEAESPPRETTPPVDYAAFGQPPSSAPSAQQPPAHDVAPSGAVIPPTSAAPERGILGGEIGPSDLGAEASLAGRGFAQPLVKGAGAAIKAASALVSPETQKAAYNQLPPGQIGPQAYQNPDQSQSAQASPDYAALAKSGPYARAIAAREREQAAAQARIAQAQQTPVEQRPAYKTGEAVQQWAEKNIPLSPEEKNTWTAAIAGGVGGAVVPVLTGAAASFIAGPLAGTAIGAAAMGVQAAGDEFDRAKAAGASDDQAAKAAGLSAELNTAAGLVPMHAVLKPVEDIAPQLTGRAWAMLRRATESGLTFAGAGEAQHYLGEQLAKEYDPNAGYDFDIKRLAGELIGGAAFGAMHGAIPPRESATYRWTRPGETDAGPDIGPGSGAAGGGAPGGGPGAGPGAGAGGPGAGAAAGTGAGAGGGPGTGGPGASSMSVPLRRKLEDIAIGQQMRDAGLATGDTSSEPPKGYRAAERKAWTDQFDQFAADIKTWSDDKLKDYLNKSRGFGVNPDEDETGLYAKTDDILKRAGHTADDIAGMSPAQRKAALDEALRAGVHAGAEEPPAWHSRMTDEEVDRDVENFRKNFTPGPDENEDQGLGPEPDRRAYGREESADQSAQYDREIEEEFVRASAGAEEPQAGTREAPVDVKSAEDVATAASVADQDHSPAQGEANNIQRGHMRWGGLDITIEAPAGGVRRGTAPDGTPFETTHPQAYGYFRGLPAGADGMHPDVTVGDHPTAPTAYVIDEVDNQTGKFRQTKSFVGFQTWQDAIQSYLGISSKDRSQIGGMRAFPTEEFVQFAKNGGLSKPVSDAMQESEIIRVSRAIRDRLLNPVSEATAKTTPVSDAMAGQAENAETSAPDRQGLPSEPISQTPAPTDAINKNIPETSATRPGPPQATEAHRETIEKVLRGRGINPELVRLVDIARAAEIHAEGIPPADAFMFAVIRSLVEDGQIPRAEAEKAFGDEASEVLGTGDEAGGESSAQTSGPAVGGAPAPAAKPAGELGAGNARPGAQSPSKRPENAQGAETELPAAAGVRGAEHGAAGGERPATAVEPAAAKPQGAEAAQNAVAKNPAEDRGAFIQAMRDGKRVTRDNKEYWLDKGATNAVGTPWAVKWRDLDRPSNIQKLHDATTQAGWSKEEAAQRAAESAGFPVELTVKSLRTGKETTVKGKPPESAGGRSTAPASEVLAHPTLPSAPLSEGADHWWDSEFTTAGRSDILTGLGIKLPAKVSWEHLSDENRERVLSRRPPPEATTKSGQSKSDFVDTPDGKLAHALLGRLKADNPITNKVLQDEATKAYGGTLAEGKFDRKDAHDALELAVNMRVKEDPLLNLSAIPGDDQPIQQRAKVAEKIQALEALLKRLPTQTVRSEEQEAFQQFSTPPHYALAVAYAANLRNGDTVLEPSAGTGSIVAAATHRGVKIIANELSPRRAELLRELVGKDGKVFTENAEQIDNVLPADVKPTVVVMNPPFSQTAGRMGSKRDTMVGAEHIEQALARLEPGGRLVAIVGRGMSMDAPRFREWWKDISKSNAVRANIGVAGEVYGKYGTHFGTRVLVIDKVPPSADSSYVIEHQYRKGEWHYQTPDGRWHGSYSSRDEVIAAATNDPSVAREKPVTAEAHSIPELMQALEPIRNGRIQVAREQPAAEPSGPQVADIGGSAGPLPVSSQPGAVGSRPGSKGGVASERPPRAPAATGRPVRVETEERPPVAPVEPGGAGQGRAGGKPAPSAGAGIEQTGSGGAGTERDLQPAGGGESGASTSGERIEVKQAVPGAQGASTLTDNLYESYEPQRVRVPGAQKHPGPLVESAAMSSVMPPVPTYKPMLPKAVIEKGRVSLPQLEGVIYAGQAHEKFLPAAEGETPKRKGFFVGDGTGTGKGTEVAGIILDNWKQGRTKAIWVSEKKKLMNDAKRDWSWVGQDANQIFDVGKTKAGEAVKAERGIGFITYDTLKGGMSDQAAIARGGFVRGQKVTVKDYIPKGPGTILSSKPGGPRNAPTYRVKLDSGEEVEVGRHFIEPIQDATQQAIKSRVDQLVDWFGKDFDGVIAFDESHNMGNAVAVKGKRGKIEAAQKALAGLALQDALPNARIVYVSATGATEVSNLAYADRLGLWGRGTPFASRDQFVNEVQQGGIAAMELIARDMKQLGLYIARSLSYDGVNYDRIEHKLDKNQREIYDTLAEAWQGVLRNINDALKITNGKKDRNAKSAAMSAFWGGHQRFFNQIITSLQMPSMIKSIERDLKEGRQATVQIVNTNEAAQERAAAKAESAEDIEDLDITPRDQIIQLVEKSFPTQQYEKYVKEDGTEGVRPVVDEGAADRSACLDQGSARPARHAARSFRHRHRRRSDRAQAPLCSQRRPEDRRAKARGGKPARFGQSSRGRRLSGRQEESAGVLRCRRYRRLLSRR